MKVIEKKFYFVQLSPREIAFNRALGRIERFLDRWIVTPLFGKSGGGL